MPDLGEDLLRFARDQQVLCFDVETTGLCTYSSKPWRIAWLVGDLLSGHVKYKRDYYIRWDNLELSAGAQQVTGFNRDEYEREARPAEEVLDEFEEDLYNPEYQVVGHNLFYDAQIVSVWRRLLGRGPDWSWMDRFLCTHLLSKAYKLGMKPDRERRLQWFYKMNAYRPPKEMRVKTGLAVMTKELGIEMGTHHQAMDDTMACYQILRKLIFLIEV